jgi:hypothetical protein
MEVGDNETNEVLDIMREEGYVVEDDPNSQEDVYAHEITTQPLTENPENESETPVVEEGGDKPNDDSETPGQVETPEATHQMSPEEEYNRILGEMSEGSINSTEELKNSDVFEKASKYDELESSYEELQSQLNEAENKEPDFANDFVKGLNEFIRNGGDPESYIKVQGVDLKEMEPIDVLKTQMKWENPDLSADDINLLLNEKYKLSDEQFTDEENKTLKPMTKGWLSGMTEL